MRLLGRAAKESEAVVRICNRLGMHARAAGKFRSLAAQYRSSIKVIRGRIEADAKSILGLMALGACKDCELLIRAQGEDADEAVKALANLIASRFGEEE